MISGSVVGSARSAYALLRALGPRWAAFRAWHELKLKSGWFERRWPVKAWNDYPLDELLAERALANPNAYLEYRRMRAPFFFFSAKDRGQFASLLSQFDQGEASPIPQAEEIARGGFRLFSHAKVWCGFPPDWQRNPLTGDRVPADMHWSRINVFAYGDIKCVWELSRFSFAYTLVRAYWRDGDDKWPELFWRLVEDWRAHNLPNRGPQWMCGQETTFRVMAWCFALYGFRDSPATTAERFADLVQMLAVSGHRIEANFEYALSQRNNHGISEALGLWTLGVLFPEFRSSAAWEEQGRFWLERLARELIYDDGGFCQHSANYHRLTLHAYVWALRLGHALGRPFSAELRERVRRAAHFMWQIQDDVSGGVPCYGANDGALVLPLDNCDYVDYRPVIQEAWFACAAKRRFEPGPWDEGLLWLFGPEALTTEVTQQRRDDFVAAESGVSALRAPGSFAVVRCPRRFKHRPAHADLLHVDLWWNGVNVAIDPGTFSYNAPPPWDGALAETRFHNTVTVAGKDQMRRAGRFLWFPWKGGEPGQLQRFRTGDVKLCTGSHRAYSRFGQSIIHRRAVLWLRDIGWAILDNIESNRAVPCALHWLLPADAEVGQGPTARVQIRAGGSELVVESGALGGQARWSVVRGDPDSPCGWRSVYYQRREPTTSVQVEEIGVRVIFWSFFGPAGSTVHAQGESVSLANGDVKAEMSPNADDLWCIRYKTAEDEIEEVRA